MGTWTTNHRAALSLSLDDGRPSQLNPGLSWLERSGIRATFFVLPSAVTANREGWQRALEAGHEIGNHTVTHPCSGNFEWSRSNALEDWDLDRMGAELDQANSELERQLGSVCRSFAYPCYQTFVGRGERRASYVPLVAQRFVAGRSGMNEVANDPNRCDLACLQSTDLDCLDPDAIRRHLTQARDEGRWLIFSGHDIGDGPGAQTVSSMALSTIADFLSQYDDVWCAPIGEIAAHLTTIRENP